MIAIYLKIDAATLAITDVGFERYGCAANDAASNIITEMVVGETLEEGRVPAGSTFQANRAGFRVKIPLQCSYGGGNYFFTE